MTAPILPGATIGVLGSGQLGRMFAIAARRLGYRVHTYSPDQDSPTGQVADHEVTASYDDLQAVAAFARDVSAVTFEFENVPSRTVEALGTGTIVRPSGQVLHTTQHRVREKQFLSGAGIPVAPFAVVQQSVDLHAGVERIGVPAIIKTASFGYDGKGQVRIPSADQAASAWARLGWQPAVLEGVVDFACEVSVVVARDATGAMVDYGAIENAHRDHILDVSVWPARVPEATAARAVSVARAACEALDVVGVLCVEMFVTRDGEVIVNELAPRPHNSGHLTIDAHVTCQFEQQVRTVCGLPLGSTAGHAPAAAMANLLGHEWAHGEPAWASALAMPNVKLHLYGKSEARPGRKMGHLTATAATPDEAEAMVREARRRLDPRL
ncbi:N5-carboxyaminoimidazole ribonucleotide synthase [Luteitalea sp. TBR-22]|uniref:5-(carboxyamino)imidazole ribonucleotide synthase n=1 Tax=Luteitalea sp. TBR-22 TaxID=2802971 RepID=UPI001AF5D464|nr:5-(carboxyamino)imidazole ribonucleotide synthase [Luteitalea sp. TBR-22]BCS35911.1 N5-carboxyaminoimidazole ribonucleotide synthase [Luteitalea sp. TBR-22]